MSMMIVGRWVRWPMVALLAARGLGVGIAAPAPLPGATNALTLDEAVRLALAANPELLASGARADAAAARAYQAGKWSNPELELNAEDWPVSNGRGFADAKQTLGITQTLPYPGKKPLDRRIGAVGVKRSEAELALRRTEIVRDVKAAYYGVLASERLVEVSTQLAALADSFAATARKRVDVGAAAFQEQLRAEVQLEQARTELSDFERAAASARLKLAALLGRPDLTEVPLSGALAETPDSALMESSVEDGLARHPSAAAAQANLDRAQLEHRRARLAPYPDVKVALAGGRVGETDQSIIELAFSVPLPLIDRGKGRRWETRANVSEAEAEQLAVRQELQRQWANAQKRYSSALQQVGHYRERILPKAEEALRLVRTGFEQGKFSFLDLLDTQRTTAEARLAYQQKLLEMNLAQAELEALLQPQTLPTSTSK